MINKKIMAKKGFTLMEMLVVASIIVILVSIAFPVANTQLRKVNVAVDDANLRSGQVLAKTLYTAGQEDFSNKMYYDIEKGSFISEKPAPYGRTEENSSKVISVIWNSSTLQMDVQWE